jgi:hypothetical protein
MPRLPKTINQAIKVRDDCCVPVVVGITPVPWQKIIIPQFLFAAEKFLGSGILRTSAKRRSKPVPLRHEVGCRLFNRLHFPGSLPSNFSELLKEARPLAASRIAHA